MNVFGMRTVVLLTGLEVHKIADNFGFGLEYGDHT